jgi:hypothetical protein
MQKDAPAVKKRLTVNASDREAGTLHLGQVFSVLEWLDA